MGKKIIGYTAGVYDLFHVGHLNILKKAKENCDELIVAVSTDELVEKYKNKKTFVPYEERAEILSHIDYVNKVVAQETMDKMEAWKKYKFDVMFVGDDWKGTDKWRKIEEEFEKVGVKIVYFPYTKCTSSTKIRELIDKNLKVKTYR